MAAKSTTVKLDRKLWLNADKSALVEDGHQDAAFLYGLKNEDKNREEAEALGYKALPKSAQADAAPAKKEPEGDGLDDQTVKTLTRIAKELGVDLKANRKKADIIAAIRAAREAKPEGGSE